ncbi:hypothetical protein M5K25_006797 [Dendrobium thyrsiflorum]|uniref:Uncharacterized protein n=1 Tax=Dendrobium thyrsiflorum TaxID=117978 RepID=A0ABD0VCR6_DENTH
MDSPPENDVCSVCHERFTLPCQANCSHWFCERQKKVEIGLTLVNVLFWVILLSSLYLAIWGKNVGNGNGIYAVSDPGPTACEVGEEIVKGSWKLVEENIDWDDDVEHIS